MEIIDDLITFFLIAIPAAAAVRIIYCVINASFREERQFYTKKAQNALIFTIIAECAVGFINVVLSYFNGGI
ncbi:MAG: hypothetical protein RR234_01190 [Christensenella sp.]